MKYLTARQTMMRISELVEQDGTNCLFCFSEISPEEFEIDHLNSNPFDNSPANHALCHRKCNLEKRDNIEYECVALEKLTHNQKKGVKSFLEDKSEYGNSPEIEHNINTNQLVKQFLEERTTIHEKIERKTTCDNITFLAIEKYGHASQVSINRIIDAYCSEVGPFMCIKENGKRYIVKRSGN